jgi:hypothetical protein
MTSEKLDLWMRDPAEVNAAAQRLILGARDVIAIHDNVSDGIALKRVFIGSIKGVGAVFVSENAQPDAINALLGEIEQLMTPMPRGIMQRRLQELRSICERGSLTSNEIAARIEAYVDRLDDKPGDAVRHVLDEWPDRETWFPKWQPLIEGVRRLALPRNRAADGLNRALNEATARQIKETG